MAQTSDQSKSKAQLIEELQGLRQRVATLQEVVAERKRVEETLTEERNVLRTLIDNVPDRIYAKDTQSRFIAGNVATVHRMGLASLDELVGRSDFDFLPRELAEQTRADEQAIIQSGQPIINREEPMDDPNNPTRWNLATKVPLRDSQGEIIGIVGMGREITERKRVEAERERLLADLARRALQLQTAAEVSHAASSILNLDELLPQVVQRIRDRFNLYYVGLFLRGETGQYAMLRAGTGEAGQQMLVAGHKLEVGDTSMIGWCIAHGEARVALDVGEEAVRFSNPLLPRTRSEMALPLASRGRVIGAMTIQSDQPAAFTQEDISALQTMADQLANGIENARLFEEVRTRAEQTEALNELNRALTTRRSVDEVLEEAYRGASRLIDTTNFFIALYNPDQDEITVPLEVTAGRREPPSASRSGDSMSEYIIRQRTPLLIREDVAGWRAAHGIAAVGLPLDAQSWLGVPMIAGDQALGAIVVQSHSTPRAFDERDQSLLMIISNQVAIALQNALLFEQAQKALREMEATYRRYLQQAWAQYRQIAEATSYETERPGTVPLGDRVLPEIRQAIQRQEAVVLTANGDKARGPSVLVMPVALRGEVIGALGIHDEDGARQWTDEEIALAEAVAERMALTAEGLRLLDETQRRAARERLVGDVTAHMRETLDIERVLRTAADEMYQTLGLDEVVVRLVPDKAEAGGR